jgi:HAD superfamily hydrolase (TIGR01458 family)
MNFSAIEGFFFDMDGVLVQNGKNISGAVETLKYLKKKGFPIRILTNRTTRSQDSLHSYLIEKGFPVTKEEIFSAPQAAVHYLRHQDNPSCCVVMGDDPKADFVEFRQCDVNPDYVILGDMNDEWDFHKINPIFNMIMSGSKLLALHKGRFWREEKSFHLDLGFFVAGLEYITGKKAIIIGKPSGTFFNMALEDIGLPPGSAVMIGDDIESDVGGAQMAGIPGILALSGKFSREHSQQIDIFPDAVIPSISSLLDLL